VSSSAAPLSTPEIAALLSASAAALRAEVGGMPERVARWHPAPGEWCASEVIGHLIEADRRGFGGRIRTMLDEREPSLVAWDQVTVARERLDCVRPVVGLLDEFGALRAEGVALVERLGEADLGRGGRHPTVGHLTVAEILHEWVHHDRNHLRQIQANVQAWAWPGMGNAQKFSGE
jgi:DinB family protein